MTDLSEVAGWWGALRGRFIVFEGADCSGKTTQARLFASRAQAQGLAVTLVREPGGTQTGEALRRLVLDPQTKSHPLCDVFLFMAARAQLLTEVVAPALARGELVIGDRFHDSTLVHQGMVDGALALSQLATLAWILRSAAGAWPDLIVTLTASEEVSEQRSNPLTRMDKAGLEHRRRVREAYVALHDDLSAAYAPRALVSADGLLDTVAARVEAAIRVRVAG